MLILLQLLLLLLPMPIVHLLRWRYLSPFPKLLPSKLLLIMRIKTPFRSWTNTYLLLLLLLLQLLLQTMAVHGRTLLAPPSPVYPFKFRTYRNHDQ
ncbi:hypothetical protein BDR26DRAFT_861218 [Obelidium mucronatum]|nr:hypothetical protein BDR26DRAFT_861218 [Obelidium mucronatum]